ncbi:MULTISPECIES: ParB/Srx family N-terminal domain-containing protein [unclassified Bradyrhizobium]|uniref:ParB/Srx family N-terminal domain-containing protein n=1 Tax=unclassified Bradyrhizobium TaxID=2631580 RepID=UPI0028EFD2C5|nr:MULTISPECIES: ParB/Srx family N-terminal domain-containing protein [unclassified Bradyrhizobium]
MAKNTTPKPRSERKLVIQHWPIEQLKPYARNSRTHSPAQVAAIAKSIEQFGFTNPVLAAEDGTIIAGHGRVMAAQSLGIKTVPVIVASDWSEQERRAYVIADNKIALDAGWDEELLKLELGELAGAGVDLDLTGFSEADLNKLFGTVEDEVGGKAPDTSAQLDGLSYSIVIRCDNEQHQSKLLEELEQQGLKAEALIS